MTIPAEIRKKYGIKGGTRIRFIPDEEHRRIFLIPMTGKYFHALAGVLKLKRGREIDVADVGGREVGGDEDGGKED
jgi:AbrB family looped-hinge helix DNA binding protein